MKRVNLTGMRFGRLLVLEPGGKHKYGTLWKCKCDCGKYSTVLTARLTSGNTTSCGCRKLECSHENGASNTTHGMSQTATGGSWQAMMNRCYNTRQPSYSRYGAVGITACEFIKQSPSNLLSLIGPRPEGLSLDRIDNDIGYYCGSCRECVLKGWPLNVRWATRIQQNRNRSDSIFLTIGGQTRHIHEWSEDHGVSVRCILHRLEAGKRELELLTPSRSRCKN